MEIIIGLLLNVLGSVFGDSIDNTIGTTADGLCTTISNRLYVPGTTVLAANSLPMTLLDLFIPIGICLCTILWGVNLMKTLNYKNPSIEMIYKSFIRLIFGCILISNIGTLTVGFHDFANALTSEMAAMQVFQDGVSGLDDFLDTMGDDKDSFNDYLTNNNEEDVTIDSGSETTIDHSINLDERNYITNAFASYYYLFYVIIFKMLELVMIWVGYTRAFELARCVAFGPIACCDVYGPLAINKALRFMRTIFATCMTQPVMFVMFVLGSKALGVASTLANPIVMFLILGSIVTLIMGSSGIAKRLFV